MRVTINYLVLLLASSICAFTASGASVLAAEDFTKPNLEESPSEAFESSESTFVLKEIEVTGNTVLVAEIAELVAAYKGKSVDFAGLNQIRELISALYEDSGYPSSGAYIPPQKVEDGLVRILVIEGEIDEVQIVGLDRLGEGYVKSRLGSLSAPLKASLLLDRLYLLRQDPLIESVSATMAAGIEPGKSVLRVEVEEAKSWSLNLGGDSYKSPSVGSFARYAKFSHLNLLGFGDRFGLSYTNTSGSNAFSADYSVPYSASGRVSAAYGLSDNDVIEDAFTALDIESKSNYWQFGLDHLVIRSATRQLGLGMEFTRQHSETSLLDSPFALSLGADEEGNTNVSAIRLGTDFVQRGEDYALYGKSQFSFGIDAFDATISEDDDLPDGRFFAWRGQGQYVKNIDDDFPVLLRGDLQLSGGELVSLEQFRLGGAGSVRGYRTDLLLGDSGFFAGVETRIPVANWDKYDALFQIAPFVDFGTVWNSGEVESITSTVASVGVGLKVKAFSDRLNGRLDWGIPLKDVAADSQPISFSLDYAF